MNLKKYFVFSFIILTLALGVSFLLPKNDAFADSVHPTLSGGSGTSTNPYKISTIDDLKSLSNYVNDGGSLTHKEGWLIKRDVTNTYEMTQNIDLGGGKLSAIGTDSHKFSAIFDGKGFYLTNGTFSSTEIYCGVFGVLSGTVKNLKVYSIGFSVEGGKGYIGGIAGSVTNATVENCASIELKIPNLAMWGVGGIVGLGSGTTITGCYNLSNLGSTIRHYIVGGIAGLMGTGCKIEYSFNKGEVNAKASAGGIVGGTLDSITIENCYNLGNIKSTGVNSTDESSSTQKILPGGALKNYGKMDGDYCTYDFAMLGTNAVVNNKSDKKSSFTIKEVKNGGSAGGILGASGAGATTINNCYNTGSISGGMEKTYFSTIIYLWRSDGEITSLSSSEILIDYDCLSGGLCGTGKTSVSNSYSTKTYSMSDFTTMPSVQPRGYLINEEVLSTNWNTGFFMVPWKHDVHLNCYVIWGASGQDQRENWNYDSWGFGIDCTVVYNRNRSNGASETTKITSNVFGYNLNSEYGIEQMQGAGAAQGTESSKTDLRSKFNSGEWFLPSDVINGGYPALKRFYWESEKTSFN